MKIGSPDSKPAGASPATADRKASMPIKVDPKTAAAEASTKVELSSSASVLASAQTLQADPSFDTAKVDRIAQAIREGKFEVNPEAIADKLIQNAQELLSRKVS